MLLQYRATMPELLHGFKTENGDDGLVQRKPIYYISLERAQREEHNEMKKSRNG
jgi:hypothetical protein